MDPSKIITTYLHNQNFYGKHASGKVKWQDATSANISTKMIVQEVVAEMPDALAEPAGVAVTAAPQQRR